MEEGGGSGDLCSMDALQLRRTAALVHMPVHQAGSNSLRGGGMVPLPEMLPLRSSECQFGQA